MHVHGSFYVAICDHTAYSPYILWNSYLRIVLCYKLRQNCIYHVAEFIKYAYTIGWNSFDEEVLVFTIHAIYWLFELEIVSGFKCQKVNKMLCAIQF